MKKIANTTVSLISSFMLIAMFFIASPVSAQDDPPTIVCKCKAGQCVADGISGGQCNASNVCSDWSTANCFQPNQD